ncbi:MAG TPA: nucleotide exchange factor GrpE [Candidatus Binataceae bacterium]|nr:nucleotide exchange factor GrpE [Candidatus Binataceae bacterium]
MHKRSKDDNGQSENLMADDMGETPIVLEEGVEEVAGEASGEASASSKLAAEIAEKDKEIADLKDKYLRTLADFENSRKRIRQQSEESVRLQRENFLRDLLPIVDNLERAVEAARSGGDGTPIVEGVEMVLRGLLDFLKSHGVTQMSAVGQPFDPQRHEAVDQVVSRQHPPNTVINEFHRGYQIGDRMLRPARVAVAKAADSGNGGHGNGSDGKQVENR